MCFYFIYIFILFVWIIWCFWYILYSSTIYFKVEHCRFMNKNTSFFMGIDSNTKICMNSLAHYAKTTFVAGDKKTPLGTYFLFNFASYLVSLLCCTIRLLGTIYLDLASYTSHSVVLLTVFVDFSILLTFMHILT